MVDRRATVEHFFVTGGTVAIDAPSYVERKADRELFETLCDGQFCYVLTSRQMGKSSLMVRTAKKLRERRVTVIALDLTAIGQNLTAEQWYDGICLRIGDQLRLEDELEAFWSDHMRLGPVQRLFAALREVVLPKAGQVVVFVDELDVVQSLPFSTDEFFAAIRECYNRRTVDPALANLTFCLMGVATPSDLIKDTRMTPFNIGRRIELADFTRAEAKPLAAGLQSAGIEPPVAESLLERILYWTRGHPYLTQRLCQSVVQGWANGAADPARRIDTWCEELFFSNRARERDDNLIFVRERLLRAEVDLAGLLHLYDHVLRGKRVRDDETDPLVSVLRLSGIACESHDRLVARNRIYQRAFDRAWVRAHLPDAEVRRQRAAFYRGMIRATALGTAIVCVLAYVALIAVHEADNARLSEAEAYFSQAQATRGTARAGQRLDSLRALRAAGSNFTNEFLLRDEVVSSLSLMDLREATEFDIPKSTGAVDVDLNGSVVATGQSDGSILIRRLGGGEVLKTLPGNGLPVSRLAFSPTQSILAAGYADAADARTVIWDWPSGKPLCSLPEDIRQQALDFSADGRKVALGRARGGVTVYSLPHGTILNDLELKLKTGRPRVLQSLRFNPSGEYLAESSLDDLYVQVWGLSHSPTPPAPFLSLYHRAEVYDIAWHPRGELLATACADFSVYVWNTNRSDQSLKLTGHEDRVSAVAFNHRGTLIASLGADETVRLWMPATDLKMAASVEGGNFDRIRFSSNDEMLLATGLRESVPKVWNVFGGEFVELHVRVGPVDAWRSLDVSPDGRVIAALNSQRAMVWDAESGRELGAVNFVNARSAWFSDDGRALWASAEGGLYRGGWARQSVGEGPGSEEAVVRRMSQTLDELGAMAVTQDRRFAAIARRDEVLLVTLTTQGQSAIRTNRVDGHYHRLALHPTAHWLAAMIAGSGAVHLWDLSSTRTNPPPFAISSGEFFTFSPEGRWFVTCWEGRFHFYEVGRWTRSAFQIARQTLSDLYAPLAFSQDGTVLALAVSRYTIELRQWTGPDGTDLKRIAAFEAPVRSPLEMLAFSPDARRLVAATQDRTLQLWNLKSIGEGLVEFHLSRHWLEFPGSPQR